jgi:hypothetical protein
MLIGDLQHELGDAGVLLRVAHHRAIYRRKLKKLLAETMLDNAILKDVASKKW